MNTKLSFLATLIASCFCLASCEEFEITPSLTDDEIVEGLKEALRVGTDTSVTVLHRTNGYFADEAVKILLPPEAQVIKDNISILPGGSALIDEVVLKINRAAEDAAVEAKPIFVNAITSMTITDGLSILNGPDTAATSYLKTNTYSSLKDLFKPKIEASLAKPIVAGISAESSYKSLVDKYNSAANIANISPFHDYPIIENNSLSEHTTTKGLNGLFLKVSEEEKAIRNDPFAQVTDILRKVFSKD